MRRFALGIQRFFGILTILCIGWMVYAFMVTPRLGALSSLYRPIHPHDIASIDVVALVVATVLIGLVKGYRGKLQISAKVLNWLFAFELVVYFLGLLWFLRWIDYSHVVDDAQVVLNWLHHYKQADPWQDGTWATRYMYSNPQNLFLMLSYKLVELIVGNHFFALVTAFCLLHIGTLALTMKILHVVGISDGYAFIVMQLYLAMIQITWQAPMVYTDTLALFFVTVMIYCLAEYFQASTTKSQVVWLVLASVTGVLAYLSKGTSLIVIVAVVVYLIVTQRRAKLSFVLIPILLFIVGNSAWRSGVGMTGIYPDQGYGQPNTHYIMMGMSNTPVPNDQRSANGKWQVGIFSSADQAYSWKLFYDERLSKKEIQAKQLNRYVKRVSAMSLSQLLQALNNKVSVVWGSGDLKTTFDIARGMADQKRGFHLFSTKKWGLPVYFVMTVTQLVLYLGIILATIKYFNRLDDTVLLGSIFISGYFAFMLLWEVNPRYAIAIVPFGILMMGKFLTRATMKHDCGANK